MTVDEKLSSARTLHTGSHRMTGSPAGSSPAASAGMSQAAGTSSTGMSGPAARALAVLRIATGFVFLWAFLDKLFGLHYSTTSARAWVRGGSPTKGFLSHVDVGPVQSLMHDIAGTWWADSLFMLGLLAIGVAVMLGVALRPAAVAGTVLLACMWLSEFPPAQHATGGAPSASTNPIVDYHVIYALALIVVALTAAGRTWGLGRQWERLPLVSRNAALG